MTVGSDDELRELKAVGHIVAACLRDMQAAARPGMTTRELDAFGAAFLDRSGARSAPQLSYGFPGATCISVNEEIAHGIPGDRVLQAGDVVNIDVSAERGGYWADTGGTQVLGPVQPRDRRLLAATRLALRDAMKEARAGCSVRAIGRAIQRRARRSGFGVIKDLASHGVGAALHEEPSIPGWDDPAATATLHEGQVITIEPFLTTGPAYTRDGGDGWTLLNAPGARSAQFEHSMVITRGSPIVLTA